MKISSLLNEDQKPNQGTVNQLPVDRDLIYRAKNKYPGYSSEQAMILLIADEMQNQEKTDSTQNRLIDTQKRENERLRSAVNDLGQELQDFEQQSVETDKEVDRLKQLSGMLTTGNAGTQQQAKVSSDDLEKLQKDLETLKTKPGMDPKVYNELSSQVKTLQTNKSTDKQDVKKLQDMVLDIEKQASVNYTSIGNELAQTKKRLAAKEKRFKEYKTSFSDYKSGTDTALKNFGTEMKQELAISRELRAGIMQDAEDISKMKVELSQNLDLINKNIDTTKNVADISWLVGGNKKPPTVPAPVNVQESISEGYDISPSRQYRNANYNEWITKHLPGLFAMFKGRFVKDLSEKDYSDKQIADTLEEYVPLLYNLGNDKTPLSAEQVKLWLDSVKSKLWEQPVQQELFNESLDKTYARMLDDIIGLAYIKKG